MKWGVSLAPAGVAQRMEAQAAQVHDPPSPPAPAPPPQKKRKAEEKPKVAELPEEEPKAAELAEELAAFFLAPAAVKQSTFLLWATVLVTSVARAAGDAAEPAASSIPFTLFCLSWLGLYSVCLAMVSWQMCLWWHTPVGGHTPVARESQTKLVGTGTVEFPAYWELELEKLRDEASMRGIACNSRATKKVLVRDIAQKDFPWIHFSWIH